MNTFYEQLEDQNLNYPQIAKALNESPEQLYEKVRNRTLTMEEALGVVRESRSPTLLMGILRQLNPDFTKKPN